MRAFPIPGLSGENFTVKYFGLGNGLVLLLLASPPESYGTGFFGRAAFFIPDVQNKVRFL